MALSSYPGGLRELDFVQAYCDSTLRKPQVVADAVMRAAVLAGANDRLVLAGLIAEQLAEAARRMAAVHAALADRRYPIAQSLAGPLPGVEGWRAFAQQAATFTPIEMLRELNLPMSALPAAEELRGQPSLGALDDIVAAAEAGSSMFLVLAGDTRRTPTEILFAGQSRAGDQVAVALNAGDGDVAALADVTADLCHVARAFLGAYLEARYGAGRRD